MKNFRVKIAFFAHENPRLSISIPSLTCQFCQKTPMPIDTLFFALLYCHQTSLLLLLV